MIDGLLYALDASVVILGIVATWGLTAILIQWMDGIIKQLKK